MIYGRSVLHSEYRSRRAGPSPVAAAPQNPQSPRVWGRCKLSVLQQKTTGRGGSAISGSRLAASARESSLSVRRIIGGADGS